MSSLPPTADIGADIGFAPQIALDRADAAELARVLGVITEFLHACPAARGSLARFVHSDRGDRRLWTDELLDYLHHTAADLHHLTHTTAPASQTTTSQTTASDGRAS